jgi:pentatricopeptide repeat protein
MQKDRYKNRWLDFFVMLRCVQLVRRAPVPLSSLTSLRWSSSTTGGSVDGEPPKNPKTCAAVAEQQKTALRLFQELKQTGLKLDAITYAAMITACASSGRHEKAHKIFKQAKAAKIALNAIMYNAAITACADGGQWKRVLQLLAEAKLKLGTMYNSAAAAARAPKKQGQSSKQRLKEAKIGIKLNAATSSTTSSRSDTMQWKKGITQCLDRAAQFNMESSAYRVIITLCVRANQWQKLMQFLEEAQAAGFELDGAAYTSLIEACVVCGQHQIAVQLLQLLNDRGVEPEAITYTAAIAACANCGEWQKALQLFEEAKAVGKIDIGTYNAAIAACASSKQWQKVVELFKQMKQYGITSNVTTYIVVMGTLNNSKQWQKVAAVYDELKFDSDVQADERVYNEALRAYKKLRNTKKVAEIFILMQQL